MTLAELINRLTELQSSQYISDKDPQVYIETSGLRRKIQLPVLRTHGEGCPVDQTFAVVIPGSEDV